MAAEERLVPLLDGPAAEGVVEAAERQVRPGVHHHAAGVHVEAVHDHPVHAVGIVPQVAMR